MKKIFLSVVISSYNEKNNLKRGVLKEVREYLKNKDFSWEVIISDDGSTDKSKQIVEKQIAKWENFKLLKNPHGGKPSGLWYGIKEAKGQYILFTDMDQAAPITELDKLTPYLDRGFDTVIGSRGIQRENFPFYRKLGSIAFMSLRKLFLLPEINDTQCGFKLFEAKLLKSVFPKLSVIKMKDEVEGWKVTSFDVELLHLIKKMNKKIVEVRVIWKEKGASGGVMRYFRESKEMVSEIIRVKLNDLRGYYNG